ncbi:MAG: glycosyltransferase family 4 protein [Candidatus Omnitrophota bacterium]
MKIAFIVHDVSDFRGHDRYTAELIRHFCHEHEISIFTANLFGIDSDKVKFYKCPYFKSPVLLKIITFFITSYFRLLFKKREGYDLIHMQGVCTLPPKNTIITAHFCAASYYRLYKKYVFNRITPLRKLYQYIYLKTCILLEMWVLCSKNIKKIIAPCESVKKEIIKYYKIDPDKIIVLYEGVDTEIFKPYVNTGHKTKEKKQMYLIGDCERNSLFHVLRALRHTKEVTLTVIGSRSVEYYKELVFKLGIADRVIFEEGKKQMSSIFAVCDIFICTSIYETFGLTALEAISCGIPTLLSRLTGVSELVEDGKNAVLINDPADEDEIASKINLLLENAALMKNLSEGARELALLHTWDKVAAETFGVYKKVLENRNVGKDI